ncbi:hypothetical protein DAI21_22910 (plasmid) [Lelliottia sp. WB101]|nr:hypothetical protein DAI21_22910 [Lelliottia sp. WB101]
MVNLGGFNLGWAVSEPVRVRRKMVMNLGRSIMFTGTNTADVLAEHYYVCWLSSGGDLDIAYLSELDPMWNDSSLSVIINPEAVLFNNPIAQAACAADAAASLVH